MRGRLIGCEGEGGELDGKRRRRGDGGGVDKKEGDEVVDGKRGLGVEERREGK